MPSKKGLRSMIYSSNENQSNISLVKEVNFEIYFEIIGEI